MCQHLLVPDSVGRSGLCCVPVARTGYHVSMLCGKAACALCYAGAADCAGSAGQACAPESSAVRTCAGMPLTSQASLAPSACAQPLPGWLVRALQPRAPRREASPPPFQPFIGWLAMA